jgi:hypothetical protein
LKAPQLTDPAILQHLERSRARVHGFLHDEIDATCQAVAQRVLRGRNGSLVITLDHQPLDGSAPRRDQRHSLRVMRFYDRREAPDHLQAELHHQVLDQTAFISPAGQPFGWTLSVMQSITTPDLGLPYQHEAACTYPGALSAAPFAHKLVEALETFQQAALHQRFPLYPDRLVAALNPLLKPPVLRIQGPRPEPVYVADPEYGDPDDAQAAWNQDRGE